MQFVKKMSCCQKDSNNTDYIRRYLQIVYPTATKFAQMSDDGLFDYYCRLKYFYRVPLLENQYTGLLSESIDPVQGVFMHPDTIAVTQQDLPAAFKGFTDDTFAALLGSTGSYIEISSFGFVEYPFGGYYNWGQGTGVYVATNGKTIAGHTKLNVLYDLFCAEAKEREFFDILLQDKLALRQLIGVDSIPQSFFQDVLAESIDPIYLVQHVNAIGDIPSFLAALYRSPEWGSIRQNFKELGSSKVVLYYLLENYYIPDHFNVAVYQKLTEDRYAYILGEVDGNLAGQDRLLYLKTKSLGYDIVQVVRQPNRTRSVSFEIMDTRWPIVDLPHIATEAIVKGLQNYDIPFVWNKLVGQGLFSLRDPFSLNDEKRAVALEKICFPALSREACKADYVQDPPSGFDQSFLPPQGWGKSQCALGAGTSPSDTIASWSKPNACPFPLDRSLASCHLIHFALDASAQGAFSVLDPAGNAQKICGKLAD